jgi:hypothetical protein
MADRSLRIAPRDMAADLSCIAKLPRFHIQPSESRGSPDLACDRGLVTDASSFIDLGGNVPQVEAIGTWSEFCFFFSLYMRHQHALVPLVHKPTFAMDVLNRRDQRDEAFRGLLFSIVTYTLVYTAQIMSWSVLKRSICQCPINMMSKEYSRERLLSLLEQCQKLSRLIHIRHTSRPSLITAASIELCVIATSLPDNKEG